MLSALIRFTIYNNVSERRSEKVGEKIFPISLPIFFALLCLVVSLLLSYNNTAKPFGTLR